MPDARSLEDQLVGIAHIWEKMCFLGFKQAANSVKELHWSRVQKNVWSCLINQMDKLCIERHWCAYSGNSYPLLWQFICCVLNCKSYISLQDQAFWNWSSLCLRTSGIGSIGGQTHSSISSNRWHRHKISTTQGIQWTKIKTWCCSTTHTKFGRGY